MKLMIAGSRSIVKFDISPYITNDVELIITGGAKGIDFMAEDYADKHKKASVRNLLVSGQIFVCKALTYTPKVYIIVGVKIIYAFCVYKH
jgi:hypothetical protein